MGDGTSNYGKVTKCDLLLGAQVCLNYHRRKKKEALLYVYFVVFFILEFFFRFAFLSFFFILNYTTKLLTYTYNNAQYHLQ